MSKTKFIITLILILLIPISALATVEYKDIEEVTVASGQAITIPLPTSDTILDDLLIVYISKDDPNPIDAHGDWTGICNEVGTGDNTLYMAYRIVTQADLDAPAKDWTWTETSGAESWIGKILTYRGADTGSPIHDSDTAFLDQDAAPIAPSVAFTSLTAGSMVLQVFGCDDDDGGYVTPGQLDERFNTAANNVGGAGGDKGASSWVSPTGFVDLSETWTDEANAYDEKLLDEAFIGNNPITSWSDYLELTINAISCNKVRTYADYSAGATTEISVDVYYSGAWHNLFEGNFSGYDRAWMEHDIGSTQTVTAMEVKFYNSSEIYVNAGRLYEADFWGVGAGGTGETGTAVFGMGASEEWATCTVIIEAEAEAPPPSATNVLFTFAGF